MVQTAAQRKEGGKNVKRERIIELFPAFGQIRDDGLREKTVSAMAMGIEQGGWDEDTLWKCPVTLNWQDCDVSWIAHVNDVTEMCILQYEQVRGYYERHGVPFCRDIMVAGALLHDIGKLTEFCLEDGCVAHRPGHELMRHPLAGALIAARAGLPDEVIHLIATHSFEGDRSFQTPESELVRAVDMLAFQCSVKGLQRC